MSGNELNVSVKALEWNGDYGRAALSSYHVSYNLSGQPWGYPERGAGFFAERSQGLGVLVSGPHDTRKEAEQSADAHYECLILSALSPQPVCDWECAARKQGAAGGNDPTDCDWPFCGCDPKANKVIEAIEETHGALSPQPVEAEPYGYAFQHEETGLQQVADIQQIEWGFEKYNPRWKKIGPVYLHHASPQPVTKPAMGEEPTEVDKLRSALLAAVETIQDYLAYTHDGDPWKEDSRAMGEMDINDYARDGRLDYALSLLAATATGGEEL